MVFQSYALYPHMSVADNISYGLRIRGMEKQEIARRVKKAAEMLELGPLLNRRPKQLSGGQRQRVAMGRAIHESQSAARPASFAPRSRVRAGDTIEVVEGLDELGEVAAGHRRVEAGHVVFHPGIVALFGVTNATSTVAEMNGEEELLRKAYAAYNGQDVDGLLALVSDDVDWPDGPERLHGKAALEAYWLDQWTRTRTHDQPGAFTHLPDGRVAVRVRQVVRSLDGSVVSRGSFDHVHRIEDSLIRHLTIDPA